MLRTSSFTLLVASLLLLVLSCSVGGDSHRAPTAKHRAAFEDPAAAGQQCANVPASVRGQNDGCNCPANGDTTCDPDCAQFGNDGGGLCGCEFCHVPPTPSVAVPPYATTQAVGILPGGGATTLDGAYVRSIPIEVPPGRAGMQPALSLNYGSRGGNGPFGVGWSLGGLSTISRCAKSVAAGGLANKITFGADDTYCLDGQPLVLAAGSPAAYGVVNSEYRTEIDVFAKVVLTNTSAQAPAGPRQWKVYRKDGLIATYGQWGTGGNLTRTTRNTAGAAMSTTSVVLEWPILLLEDRKGNQISFSYQASHDSAFGAALPLRIEYTKCTSCGYSNTRTRVIDFQGETRSALDQRTSYVNGVEIKSNRRIGSISVSINNDAGTAQVVRRYRLRYTESGSTKRTLLEGVRVCDAANVCLPETTFTYQGKTAIPYTVKGTGSTGKLLTLARANERESSILVYDADADGNDDILFKSWATDANGSIFTGGLNSRAPMDRILRGDGAGYFDPTFYLVDHDNDGLTPADRPSQCTEHELMDPGAAMPVDLDGDGKLELVGHINSGCSFQPDFKRIGPMYKDAEPAQRAHSPFGVLSWNHDTNRLVERLTGPMRFHFWTESKLQFADVNGDALPELFIGDTTVGPNYQVTRARSTAISPPELPQIGYPDPRTETNIKVWPTQTANCALPPAEQTADRDGDGHQELLQIATDGKQRSYSWAAFLPEDTARLAFRDPMNDQTAFDLFVSRTAPGDPGWGTPASTLAQTKPWRFLDVNGDGLKDALYSRGNLPAQTWFIRINTGAGYAPEYAVGGSAATMLTGYPDYNTMRCGTATILTTSDQGLRIADMNGDGRDDILLLNAQWTTGEAAASHPTLFKTVTGAIRVLYSNGVDFNAPVALPTHGLGRLFGETWMMTAIGDVDGNSLPDIVEMAAEPGTSDYRRRLITYSMFAPGGVDVLTNVHDERGEAERITYDSLSRGSTLRGLGSTMAANMHAPAQDHFPTTYCEYPAACTARGTAVKYYADYRKNQSFEYAYAGARADVTGRGWLGFALTSVRNVVTDVTTDYRFDQTARVGVEATNSLTHRVYPFLGRPVNVVVKPPGGNQTSSLAAASGAIVVTRTTASSAYTSTFPIRKTDDNSTTEEVEPNNVVVRRNIIEVDYDQYGSPTLTTDLVVDLTRTSARDESQMTNVQYNNDPATWLVGLPRHSDVTLRQTRGGQVKASTLGTDYEYDAQGFLKKTIREPAATEASGLKLTTTLGRDTAGVLTSISRTSNGQTRNHLLGYDPTGSLQQVSIDPVGHARFTLFDPLKAFAYANVDENGFKTVIKRDGLGRVRQVNGDDGSESTTSYGTDVTRSAVTDGAQSAVFHDVVGRPVVVTASTFDGGTVAMRYIYDSLHNVKQVLYGSTTTAHATAAATLASAQAVATLTTSTAQFDALNRQTTSSRGSGGSAAETLTYRYVDWNEAQIEDETGVIRFESKDVLDRVETVSWNGPLQTALAILYRYNELGLLESLETQGDPATDPGHAFEYDKLGRRTIWSFRDELGLNIRVRSTWGYNGFGDITSATEDSRALSFTHDRLGRVRSRTEAGGDVLTYTYDGDGSAGKRGRMARAVFGDHETRFDYDALGRMILQREVFPSGGGSLSLGFGYDGRGRLGQVRYPETQGSGDTASPLTGGLKINYTYRNGQVEGLAPVANDGTVGAKLWRVIKRHPLGMVTEGRDLANVSVVRAYEPNRLRLTSAGVVGSSGSATVTGAVPAHTFTYKQNGLLNGRRLGGSQNMIESFGYDNMSRLTSYHRESSAGVHDVTYSYSGVGNPKLIDTLGSTAADWPNEDETYTYPTSPGEDRNLLRTLAVGTRPVKGYSYDAQGNVFQVTEGGTLKRTYTYNSFDLPKRVQIQNSSPNFSVDFAYNAFGARVRKTSTQSNDVAYLGTYYERRNLGGPGVRESVFRLIADGAVVGEITKPHSGGAQTNRTFHKDHQGSIVYQTVGTAGTYLGGFFPYGKRMSGAVQPQNFSSLGYTGHRHDDDLGLINMNGRVYDVTSRRFLSRDAMIGMLDNAAGGNTYGYAVANPLNFTDPTGFQVDGGTGSGAGAGMGSWYGENAAQMNAAAGNSARSSVGAHAGANAQLGGTNSAAYQTYSGHQAGAGAGANAASAGRAGATHEPPGPRSVAGAAQDVSSSAGPVLAQLPPGQYGPPETLEMAAQRLREQMSADALHDTAQIDDLIPANRLLKAGWRLGKAGLGWVGSKVVGKLSGRGAAGGLDFAHEVIDGGTGRALAGHGEYRLGSGEVTVPDGTTLTVWTSHGKGIPDEMGRLIEMGHYDDVGRLYGGRAEGAMSLLPGASMPNYTLKAPSGLRVMSNSMTVNQATTVSELLRPNMGHLDWAACLSCRF